MAMITTLELIIALLDIGITIVPKEQNWGLAQRKGSAEMRLETHIYLLRDARVLYIS